MTCSWDPPGGGCRLRGVHDGAEFWKNGNGGRTGMIESSPTCFLADGVRFVIKRIPWRFDRFLWGCGGRGGPGGSGIGSTKGGTGGG